MIEDVIVLLVLTKPIFKFIGKKVRTNFGTVTNLKSQELDMNSVSPLFLAILYGSMVHFLAGFTTISKYFVWV